MPTLRRRRSALLPALVAVAAALTLGLPGTRADAATDAPGMRAYVVEPGANAVAVVDLAGGRVITTLAVGRLPRQAAVSSDGRRVYVANAGSASVSVIDAVSDTVIATIPVPGGALRLVLAPNGHHLYVAGSGVRTGGTVAHFAPPISVIDTARDEVVQRFAGDTTGTPVAIAISHDGRVVYLMCPTQRVNHPNLVALDVATGRERTHELVRTVPAATTLMSRGDRLYVIESQLDRVLTLDDATGIRQAPIDIQRPIAMAVDSTGNALYVLGAGDEISVLRSADHHVVDRFSVGAGAMSVALTPDSRELVVNHPAERTLTIDDARSGRALRTIDVGGDGSSVAVSPAFRPELVTAPTDQALEFGQPAILSAEAQGQPAPAIQWQRSTDGGLTWSPIEHAGYRMWSFTPDVADSGDQYRAVFTNRLGHVVTRPVSITVVKATPVIEWPDPIPLSAGHPLPAADLDARAETPALMTEEPIGPIPVAPSQRQIPGAYTFAPAAGTVLPVGTDTLTVTFTPSDTRDYNPATVTVPIRVQRPPIAPSSGRCTARTGLAYLVPRRLRARSTRILGARVIDSAGRPVRVADRRGWRIVARLNGLPVGRYRLRVVLRAGGRQHNFTTAPIRCSTTRASPATDAHTL